MWGERDKLRKELLSKKELGLLGLSNLGNSQPMRIAKIAKIRRFTVRKACSEEKSKGVAGQPFASGSEWSRDHSIQLYRGVFKEIRYVTHGSP